jgi:hypothetical protein
VDQSELVKKSLVSGLGSENSECEVSESYRISGGGLRPNAEFLEDENSQSEIGAKVSKQTPSRVQGRTR